MERRCALCLSVALVMLTSACGGDSRVTNPAMPQPVVTPPGQPGPTQPPPPPPPPPPLPPPVLNPMSPQNWEIGPIVPGYGNYSVGMPLQPSAHADGWAIDFPQPNSSVGHVHYVTMRHGSLSGKTRIVMRFRIEAAPDVKIVPRNFPDSPGMLTLYFQRAGDNWSASGPYETYRWWATPRTITPLAAGEYEVIARFDENWTAILTSSAFTNPPAFQAALANADRVGFTLGGGDGFGHGVYATGPARLVVTSFTVE